MNNSNNKLVHILVTLCYCGGTIMIYYHETLHKYIGIGRLAKKNVFSYIFIYIYIGFFFFDWDKSMGLTKSLTMPRVDQSKPFSLFSKLQLANSEQDIFEAISFEIRNE